MHRHTHPASFCAIFILLLSLLYPLSPAQALDQTTLTGPAGSGRFGTALVVLSNGNLVVTDPNYAVDGKTDVGAVYLYDGTTLALLATLTGSHTGDQVGLGGVTSLSNSNYVVNSPNWANGEVAKAGAVTWCSGVSGCAGAVTSANSLVGSKADDQVGLVRSTSIQSYGVFALSNGNYVVNSSNWDNGSLLDAGAVTWCNGVSGCAGPVLSANSLIGSSAGDKLGEWGGLSNLTLLSNGNYVVSSYQWDYGTAVNAGAVTWCNGSAGCAGTITSANSLIGSATGDQVGVGGIRLGVAALSNGNYVVSSPSWGGGTASKLGAVTWCSGTTGCKGSISSANSLVGSVADDQVGYCNVTTLANGNYVVASPLWRNGVFMQAGAVTWCNGTTGCKGAVTSSNSLVGSSYFDQIGLSKGLNGVTALANGNYVVNSADWDDGSVYDVGAVTWCDGSSGCVGPISSANSLVGSAANDDVGEGGVTALSNGHYVALSSFWNNGFGAVTWCNGTLGCTGVVTTTNSLVGSTSELVGYGGVTALTNGHYVVNSYYWVNGTATDAGAVTWCNGTVGCMGNITSSNSLVGTKKQNMAGYGGVTALSNGNYVVLSPYWDSDTLGNIGAATWCNGAMGCTGPVTTANSLVGGTAGDLVGAAPMMALSSGNYIVRSPYWDLGATSDVGAVSLGDGHSGATIGTVGDANSLHGTAANGGVKANFAYDAPRRRVAVGWPLDNLVMLTFEPNTCTVSGNAGVGGATLSFTDGTLKTVTASANGSYLLAVACGWSGTVTPSRSSYVFTPSSRSYTSLVISKTGENYTAAVGHSLFLPVVVRP